VGVLPTSLEPCWVHTLPERSNVGAGQSPDEGLGNRRANGIWALLVKGGTYRTPAEAA
jgi:hypothetical protein